MPINRIKGEGDDLVDVEELAAATDNIHGKKGLVTKSEMYGRQSATRSSPLKIAEITSESLSNYGYRLIIASNLMGFDGTNWQKWNNNTEGTLLASAARTATTYSTDQTNYNHKGIYIFINVSAIVTAPSITVRLSMKDSISGLYGAITAVSAPITAVGNYIVALHPALIDTAGVYHLACDGLLPRTWRLRIAHVNSNSITYSVSYALTV